LPTCRREARCYDRPRARIAQRAGVSQGAVDRTRIERIPHRVCVAGITNVQGSWTGGSHGVTCNGTARRAKPRAAIKLPIM
ncbi:hypothetical protein, partial [Escherichia coli]|uniref:hypothetical protein n=1 Tax=Escherichia coli TaxID=562 RepID=UPI003CE58AFD